MQRWNISTESGIHAWAVVCDVVSAYKCGSAAGEACNRKKKPKIYPEVLGYMQENSKLIEFVAGLQVEEKDVDMIDK